VAITFSVNNNTVCVSMVILQRDPSRLDHYGQILLHGKGYDRWFDKSFTLCIGSNGRVSHKGIKLSCNQIHRCALLNDGDTF